MKPPRDVSAEQLLGARKRLGYEVLRSRGSHARLRHAGPPAHFITIPLHSPLKTGTLHGILTEVARMRSTSVNELVRLL